MKKRILTMALVMLLTVSLIACNTAQPAPQPTQQQPEAQPSAQPEQQETGLYSEGTFTAGAQGHNGELTVETTFSKSEIVSVKVLSHSETEGISDAALARIPEEIVSAQSLAVDTVSGATYTSEAILSAVADCVQQAGGDAQALREKTVERPRGEDEEITADVLVIGAGASGTTAALAAAEGGAKVVVLEVTATPGGAATQAYSAYAAGSSLDQATQEQTAKKIEDDLAFLMKNTRYLADRAFLNEYLSYSGPTIDWLMGHGMGFMSYAANDSATFAERGVEQFVKLHEHMAAEYGVQTLYETHGDALMTGEQGKVIGATATKADGGTLTIHAQSVVLATGGFGANSELLEKHIQGYTEDLKNDAMANDGSGHLMAWDVGAKVGAAGVQVQNYTLPRVALEAGVQTRGGELFSFVSAPLLWVTRDGARFVNEDIATDATLAGNVVYKEGNFFAVFDQATVDAAMSDAPLALTGWRGEEIAKLEHLDQELDAGIETGFVFKGDTLQALAQSAGMSADTLSAHVERYNESVAANVDAEYGKSKEALQYAVSEGPFYAVRLAPRFYGTLGGLTINNDYQIINQEGNVISGLYAAGLNAEEWMGATYLEFSGGTLGFALTSGRLAGENAVEALQ
ncbi:FAD-binding protein [Christensenellaceae bacterium OttesenSCG-928-M15]|nr:FAD-binding protein [Christensenellaceae bacterium OttesenSCG-928-M15]